jgi:RNA polymerase sigma-70 factor (ECF subfamily)
MMTTPHLPAEIAALFRREAPRLISVLTRIFGPRNLELAEDVVQESFVAAVEHWQRDGVPRNPSAWLLTAARNRALDAVRRERTRRKFADDLAVFLDSEWTVASIVDEAFTPDPMRDDQLRMIFMCCSAALSPESRVTLILRTLCGLGVPAIARALLTTESAVNKRLYRTRRLLRGVEFTLPDAGELPAALETVHTALYLLFNEGYLSTGDRPVLRELCRDAMSLTKLLVDAPELSDSDTVALFALMCFNVARMDSRVEQGFRCLRRTGRMDQVAGSRFHFEAAIAARHCTAETFADTDWTSICNLYDRLLEAAPSPLAELNRAVAVSYRDGPAAALPLVERIRSEGQLPHGHVVAAVLANLHARAGSEEPARRFLREALAAAGTDHERELIRLQFERARRPSP